MKVSDVDVIRYRDHSFDGFGNTVLGTREFIEKHPRTFAAFVKGLNRAMKDMVSDASAAPAALKTCDPLLSMDTEAARLKPCVRELLLAKNVRQNGFSAVEPKRLDASIAAVAKTFGQKASLWAASAYTDRFLPSRAERIPPAFKA